MIYLDNAATMKPFDAVLCKMKDFASEKYYNPSALYAPAFAVSKTIEDSRATILKALGGKGKLFFTSCATESNTWVFGSGVKNKKGNVVISMGEHASVYENAKALTAKGYDVRYVNLRSDGTVDTDDFAAKIDSDTALVSVMHCSNETGAVNDIKSLVATAKRIAPHALFHSDGVQAFGKIAANCVGLGVDMYSISAHKIGGPKGVGALWVSDGLNLSPLLHGGGQESGYRSGTENTLGIYAFAAAVKEFAESNSYNGIEVLRETIKCEMNKLPNVTVNEASAQSPYILSLSISGIKAEILQRLAAEKGVLIGLGSACASRLKNNRVLSAMGRSAGQIEGSIRISFSPHNLHDDISYAVDTLRTAIGQLKGIK